jgi:hypothetical protein
LCTSALDCCGWTIGCQIERTAGFIGTTLIYFCSGIGGDARLGHFDPYQGHGTGMIHRRLMQIPHCSPPSFFFHYGEQR